jgi:uncharacterized protein (TIGR00299 family) protein
MKLLIDPTICGVSGDMLLSALIDAGGNPQFLLNFANISRNLIKNAEIEIKINKTQVNEINATQIDINIKNDVKFTAKELIEYSNRISKEMGLSDKAINKVNEALILLIDAEKSVHAISKEQDIELDETGSIDTVIDVIGVSHYLIDEFNVDDIISLPVSVGGGRIIFSHGNMSVPPPAVLKIAELRGIPIMGGPVETEVATPTGMALLGAFVKKFVRYIPSGIIVKKIGYGAGHKRFENVPNLLRIIFYEDFKNYDPAYKTQYVIFETNVDDVSPELLGYFLDKVISNKIVIDGYITPILMKKGRPAHLLTFLLTADKVEELMNLILNEIGSLGGRFYFVNKFEASRDIEEIEVDIKGNIVKVPIKVGFSPDGKIATYKAEYEVLKELSSKYKIPIKKLKQITESEALKRFRERF